MRTRAKEGVLHLMQLWECVKEHKEVNSRPMWVKIKVDSERRVII